MVPMALSDLDSSDLDLLLYILLFEFF